MNIRVAMLGGDELVRRGLESMLRTLGGFEMGSIKDRVRAPVDIALVETYGTALDDTTLARAVADPYIRRVAVFTWNHHPGLVDEHLVHEGQPVVAPPLVGQSPRGPQAPSEADMLTARERETLALIATGRSNDEIARHMRISLNSVKSYIRSAYRKTGVQSRSQAVLWAVTHGVRVEVLQDA